MMNRILVMYARRSACPFVTLARRVLADYAVDYREVFIDDDDIYRQRVLDWTGFLSVPTLVVADPGSDLPYETPAPLPPRASPRGIDRGAMITEPNQEELLRWLQRHGLIEDLPGERSGSL